MLAYQDMSLTHRGMCWCPKGNTTKVTITCPAIKWRKYYRRNTGGGPSPPLYPGITTPGQMFTYIDWMIWGHRDHLVKAAGMSDKGLIW